MLRELLGMIPLVIFILQVLLFAPFRTTIPGAESDLVGICFISINVALLILWAIKFVPSKLLAFFFIGLACREFLLFANYYQWFPVPHSGADTEGFWSVSMQNFVSGGLDYFYTNYVYVVAAILHVDGPIRLIAQQLNVVLGMGVMFAVIKIFDELGFSEKTKRTGALIIAVFPQLCVFSAILLREAPIEFCLAYSALFFIRWMKKGSAPWLIAACAMIIGAAWFHGGCVFLGCGYIAAAALYRPAMRKNALSPATVGGLILGAILVVALVPFMDARVDEMQTGLEEGEDVVNGEAAADAAGSAYLTWLTISNPYLLVLFSPLKMFYFLYSPIPFDWRGAMDIVAFFFDSTFYIGFTIAVLRGFRKIRDICLKNICRYLAIGVLGMTFAFAFGTIASGTAIRHRAKTFSIFLPIALACSAARRRDDPILTPPTRPVVVRAFPPTFPPKK